MATSQNLIPLPMLRSALGDFMFDVWAFLLETRGSHELPAKAGSLRVGR